MLIEFKVGNYRSFNEIQTLSFEATPIREFYKNNVAKVPPYYNLLRSVVIYGANSSGKSNLLKALTNMFYMLLVFDKKENDEIGIPPFLLNTKTENEPSFFEITFLIDGIKYRYGFEWLKNEFVSEWLFRAKKRIEKPLFIREGQKIDLSNDFKEGERLEEKTRPNRLFLSVVNQFNGEISEIIFNWAKKYFILRALEHRNYSNITLNFLEDEKTKYRLSDLYQSLDLGFDEVKVEKMEAEPNEVPDNRMTESELKEYISKSQGKTKWRRFVTTHKKFDHEGKFKEMVDFNLERESDGTEKILNISGVILLVLMNGGILVVDEFDTSLHPILTRNIVKMFNSSDVNINNAQLIFTTHDTNLLSSGDFRRDQIYFTEKDRHEATSLYSLVEYKENKKKIRNDASYEKDYITGRYGAIPFIESNKTKVLKNK